MGIAAQMRVCGKRSSLAGRQSECPWPAPRRTVWGIQPSLGGLPEPSLDSFLVSSAKVEIKQAAEGTMRDPISSRPSHCGRLRELSRADAGDERQSASRQVAIAHRRAIHPCADISLNYSESPKAG
jgi:hypothetical protein